MRKPTIDKDLALTLENHLKPRANDDDPVRVNVRLPQKVFEDLNWLAKELGISQKKVITRIIQALLKDVHKYYEFEILKEHVTQPMQVFMHEFLGIKREQNVSKLVRKTVVASKKTLRELNICQQAFKLSTDEILFCGIKTFINIYRCISEDYFKELEDINLFARRLWEIIQNEIFQQKSAIYLYYNERGETIADTLEKVQALSDEITNTCQIWIPRFNKKTRLQKFEEVLGLSCQTK